MPADAKLALRPAETVKAPPPSRGVPPEQSERPADTPVTRRDAPSELPERPAEKPRSENAVSAPAVDALGVVCAAAARPYCRKLLVRRPAAK